MDGYIALVLHAHLPYVRHPEYAEFLEEDWLYEAITETYLPMLDAFEGLWRDGIDFRVSMTMSPPLISMLNDELLRDRYSARIAALIQLAKEERDRREGHLQYLADWYVTFFERRREQYEEIYQRDLVGAFREFQNRGRLEILTCGATHGFLPLMQGIPQAVNAQVRVAVDHYWQNFERAPRGIWLPECGYFPGLDRVLADHGIRYFIGETHCVEHAVPRPDMGPYAPIYTPSGTAVFARDQESSSQVWSSLTGYPGHPDYRDFYRDLGWDAEWEHIRPYVQTNGDRKMVGIKYHRVTGKTDKKELWDPHWAKERAAEHAGNFVENRRLQTAHLRGVHGRSPVIVAPYDAELFGHWWFEGPWFIDYVVRKAVCDAPELTMTTPGEYLDGHPRQQLAQPNFSTWGENGYGDVWLHPNNDWIYKHLLAIARRMVGLAHRFEEPTDIQRRALNQAAREVLLAQSSDWAFILKNETAIEYAVKRTKDHVTRFNWLHRALTAGEIDEMMLGSIELRDNIFPHIDYRVYR